MEGIVDLAEVGLIYTEIAEAMEEIRSGNTKKEETEHADTIIRLMNYTKRRGLAVEEAILAKHKVNMKRDTLHNRKI